MARRLHEDLNGTEGPAKVIVSPMVETPKKPRSGPDVLNPFSWNAQGPEVWSEDAASSFVGLLCSHPAFARIPDLAT